MYVQIVIKLKNIHTHKLLVDNKYRLKLLCPGNNFF